MKNILKWFSVLVLSASTALAAEPLLLQWGTIDTSGSDAQAESAALKAKVARKAALARARKSTAPEERAAYIVQFPGPVTEEWRTWLEASTQVRGYLPEFAYLVWATATEMETIAANPDVFWTGEWKKDYKTVLAGTASPSKTTASATADEVRWMQVGSLLTGDDGAAGLRARLEALPAEVRSAFPRLDGSSAVAYLTDAQIDEVAAWPDVEWIEPKFKARLFNDKAALTNMMNVANAWKSLSSGGLGLTGSGQIVAVADTGCDKGSTSDTHADFAGRIKAGYGWTNGAYQSSASWADLDAHGTHVCGSILGSGAASTNLYRGMAYEAQLVMQGMWEDLGGLPDHTADMLKQAYSAGARIHSDSWGFGTNYAGAYVYDSVYSDGYMWTNQNFLMVIAAGNDGIDKNKDGVIDTGSVSAPGTAKNCLCVGAAENYRSSGGYSRTKWGSAWSSDYPADPIKTDYISGTTTPQGLAAFSGRGPTKDGRYKPDIVAPGTDVISVRGRMAQDDGWGVNTANTNYLYEGGTSMATPLTSGATALVRQWLVDRKGINEPMAALMKALLINGARDMTPGQYGTGSTQEITARPDRSQGFGHVNLYNSLEPGDGNFLVFVTNKLTTSANFTTNIAVGQANAGKYLLTLVWQDYPGSSGGSKNLVNDLDLTVTSPSGTVYYPNNLSGLDHTNNVEFIEFTATETGTYSVKVNGYSVSKTSPNNGQPFALVMRGPETVLENAAPQFSSSTATASGVLGTPLTFSFASLLTAGYPNPTYTITSTTAAAGTYSLSSGVLTFNPTAAGTFTFVCRASNSEGNATCTLTATISLPPPSAPTGLAVSGLSTTSFTASWNAAANAESYSLDIATVSGSATPSALISEDFSSSMGWTSSGTSYTSGTHEDSNGTWTYENAIFHPSDSASSPGSAGNIQLQKNTYLYFPTVDNPTSVSINAKGSSTGSMILQQQVNGSWTVVETKSISSTVANYTITITDAGAATAFRVYSSDRALYLYDITVTGASASYTSLTGYPKSVSGTTSSVTDLTPSTDYGVRVRSVNSAGTSDWTAWVAASTTAGDSAPVWSALPAQTVTVGNRLDFVPGDYLSGSPTPTVTLKSTTAPSGTYSYSGLTLNFTPSAAGTNTFTFLASNSLGTATATLTVTASDFVATSYAVSVGVNEYKTSYVPSSNWLEGCVPDATHIRQQITTRGDWAVTNVSYLTNAAATLANVRKAITNAAAKAVSGDKFLYYHSSHGDTGALCTYNSDYTKSQLATDLAKFKSGVKVVVMIDACHSASMYKAKGIKKTLDLADFAAQVSAEIDAIRADELARGVRRAVPRIASSEIGWITAADSDQYSWDGEDGGAFTEAVIEGWTNGICDNATYGNQDGYANFYELWNYAKDIATGQAASGEDHTDAQCTNVTVLTSTIAGWVGATAPVQNEPPAFSSSTATASGVVGETFTFDFSTLLTAGSSPLTYYMYTSVSPYNFTPSTGVLSFTPAAAGTNTFTCSVRNDYGTADCTLTVTVTLPPVTVPVLTVTNITATGALASWTACDGVTSYTLQLASDDQFSTGGSGGTVTLFSNDATDPSAAPTDWTYNINNASGSYLQLMSGHYIITEAFDASACLDLSLSLYMRTYGGTSYPSVTVQYSTDNGNTWSDSLGTLSAANTTMAQRTLDVSAAAGSSSVRLRIASTSTSSTVGVGIKTIVLTGTESAGAGSIISTETVSGTSGTFSNLTPETTYYARVKGTADWSNVAEFTTESAGDSAPVWSAIPAQTVDVGTNCWLNLADYVSGSPAPTITLVSTTADSGDYEFEDGYLMFAPPAGGTYTFDFTAANSVGSADATLTVIGHAEAPSLTASLGTSISSTVGDNVEFTVTATGIPAPASIGATCTEDAYFVFENGAFLFDSPSVGTYHFVFTATNVAGTDTLTVTVEVSAAPVTVPTLTVTDVTDTTALASWTACDDVSSYTLQLSTNAFPAASGSARSATPILSEDFVGFTPTSTTDIGSNNTLSNYTATSGWTGFKVYPENETAKIGASSGQGWLMTPALDASGTLTVVWSAYRYGTSDKNTILLGVSENGTDFDEETVTIGDEMAGYTNTFTVAGPTVYVRWMASGSSKARFYLDNVLITNSGGDDPGDGSLILSTNVTSTSYTFTGLSPYTIYYARVKGNADWSNVEEFLTEETPPAGTAPSWSSLPTPSLVAGTYYSLTLSDYVDGDPAPVIILGSSTAPSGDYEYEDGLLEYQPTAIGTFTFAFTASNDYGTANATLTVTVTGSAPVWQTLPAQTIAVGNDCELYLTSYVSGTPAPTLSLTTGADIADFDPDEDNYFYFTTSTAGTYTFVFTASNVLGTTDATLTVIVTAAPEPPADSYEQWIADNGYPEEPENTIAANGETYYDNYIADIDPTSTNELEIVPNPLTGSTFTITSTSSNRYYQFIYSTNLAGDILTTNLGWGATAATNISFPADWYGSIRVLLDEPAEP